jgi:putative DNA primase/helicase
MTARAKSNAKSKKRTPRSAGAPGIDLDAAAKFLRRLDRGAETFTFQSFSDKKAKDRRLARILHGTLAAHADELRDLNKRGAGIFVSLNATDGAGRRAENITRLRAVRLDLDGGPLDPVWECKLKPHMVVESSPGRFHVYWRVSGGMLGEFEDIQRGVAKAFDGDPAVAKLTDCARLPGFDHHKGEPFRVKMVEWFPHKAHSWDDILATFPPEATPHKAPGSVVVLVAGDYLGAARAFLAAQFASEDHRGLVAHRDDYFKWAGSHYEKLGRQNLRSEIYQFLEGCVVIDSDGKVKPYKPSRSKVAEVLAALAAGANEDESRDPPFWLPPINRDDGKALIACRNGLLNIETGKLEAPDPYFFNVNCLPFDYDPAARAPTWIRFLRDLWPEDKEARLTLAEWIGHFLTADTSQQKIHMLIGPIRSGKGTIGRVLEALLGRDNHASPPLASLGNEFGLAPLLHKRVAIIADARLGSRSDTSLITERLLSISGEDSLTINRKYQTHWTGRLGVRFLILTNELPTIKDASQALASRFMILTLENSFFGREDLTLESRLRAELPGILNWSLRGLARLQKRGYFIMPESSQDALQALEDLSSPVGAFVRAWCETGTGKRVNTKVLFGAWKAWAEARGERAGSDAVFGKNLRAAAPHVRPKNAGRRRYYIGVGLSEYGQERYERAGVMG